MTELLDTNTLIKRLRYQGRQYAAGQASRGGSSGPHLLEQAADELEIALAEGDALRARLEALAKQKPFAYRHHSGVLFKQLAPGVSGLPLYLAAGARPVEPVQKLRPDFIAGYDAGMADAKRIQAHQPAPAERTGCELGCTTECKAKLHGCASECPALPWQPQPAPAAHKEQT